MSEFATTVHAKSLRACRERKSSRCVLRARHSLRKELRQETVSVDVKALVERKYRLLFFSSSHRRKPGPEGDQGRQELLDGARQSIRHDTEK